MSWQQVKLGDIFEIARGGSPRPIDQYITDDPTGLNWISIKDASNSSKYIYKTEKKIKPEGLHKTRLVHADDFLLTNSMSFGRPYIMKTTGCIHDGWLVLSADKTKVDTDYFYHLLGSDFMYRKFVGLAAGAVVKNLNTELVKSVSVPLPPLAEQRRIASILDQADVLRQKRQQTIEKLDQLLQATFIDMFGDPMSNPKGWEKKKIKQVLTKLTDGTHHSPPAMDEGIPYITAKHIKEGFIDFYSKPTFVSIEDHKAIYSRCDPIQGDVLYIKDGATTGIASINYFDFEFSLLSSVALLRPNPKLLTSDYLESWLNHKTVKQNILQNMGGAAIKRLTLAKIKDLDILVPNLENQNIFSKVKRQIYIQRQILERSFNIQNNLFQSLQNQAFSGTL
ncbi:restriction endonuclease subunit S [Acinetobacter baumannii]|uniref:restriction endonuclease subunit S n=1 Tax=Acinetobacter baumannii TaxID=470 RepID=UPI0002AED207|nr:restriction endonuclease subunit S [Acinetobacter baumannii]ELX04647.1 type I restriction modification DNA specificity domain protein [Acinetobacter baumannii Naval-57]TPT13313.1 restriction endonuclease subunit S [Acinetobacter baumannii]